MNVNPKRCASGQKCEPETLVESIYCLVHHSRIPLKAIAEAIGHRPTYLAQAANADYDAVAFQAASLVPAMRSADNYGPLRFMAQQCGFLLVPMPAGAADGVVIQMFLALAKETGDVSSEIHRGYHGDGKLDPDERKRIVVQVRELMTVGAGLIQELESGGDQ